jgi:hypothetical protein
MQQDAEHVLADRAVFGGRTSDDVQRLARACSTAMVCGSMRWLTSTRWRPCGAGCTRCRSAMASAAAVASSSSDALAISMPVRSAIIVWKLIKDSRRPCAISA